MSDINIDDEFDYTQDIRKKLIESSMDNGQVPKDIEDKEFISGILNGYDRATTARARVKSDNDKNKNDEQIAGNMAEILKQITPRNQVGTGGKAPSLPDSLETPALVEGELSEGVRDMTIEEFTKESED